MRCVIETREGFINVAADRLEIDQDRELLIAYDGKSIAAVCDLSVIMTAHISEKRCDNG